MRIADLNPQLFRSIRDLREEEKQRLCIRLNLDRLFPPDYNFTKACSCPDCDEKTGKLLDFDAEIICRTKLTQDNLSEISKNEFLCMFLQGAAIWTKQILDLLHKKLKDVVSSEDVFQQFLKCNPASDLEDACRQLDQYLINGGVTPDPEEMKQFLTTINDDDEYYDEHDDVLKVIETGINSYDETPTRVKVKADSVLQKIKKIEEEHQEHKKKWDEKHKTPLPKSTSRKYIEDQIQKLHVKELTDTMSVDRKLNFGNAWMYICLKCAEMRSERMLFWGRHHGNLVTGHDSNEVNQTLYSLLVKVESFEKEWEKDFAYLFTSNDRSNPKRQRTEYVGGEFITPELRPSGSFHTRKSKESGVLLIASSDIARETVQQVYEYNRLK